ncbi:putative reverse transcriptase domain-containing protein [Tanacetum coccineum]
MNDDTPVGVASGVIPSVVDMTVEMEMQNSLDNTTVPKSFPPLSTPVATTAGNAPGKSSYANITGKPSGKKVNVRTLFTPGGNGIDVVVPGKYWLIRLMFSSSTGLFSFQFSSMNGLDAMLENGPWFIRNNPLILKKWHPDENLLKEDVSTVPVWVKLHGVPVTAFSKDGLSAIATKLDIPLMLNSYTSEMCMQSWEGYYTCNIHVEYEWKPPRCSSCKVFGHIHEEFPKNRGVDYRHVPKMSTASSRGNKKKGVEPTIEVSNSNPFDVLNSVDNDGEFGTNSSNTPIDEKIDKIER